MYTTVREIMNLEPFSDAQIISGIGGMDNIIKSVTVMDLPDLGNWLKGYELVLANGYTIKDDICNQRKLIMDLKEKNSSALAIKLKRFLDEIPEEVKDLSNKFDIPIIVVSNSFSWIDIIDPVVQSIVNKQHKIIDETIKIQNEIMKVTLEGGDLNNICSFVSKVIEKPLSILDVKFDLLGYSDNFNWEMSLKGINNHGLFLRNMMSESKEINLNYYVYFNKYLNEYNKKLFLLPIEHYNKLYGYIAIVADVNFTEMSEIDIARLQSISVMCALEIIKKEESRNIGRRFRNAFLAELIEGNYRLQEEIIERAKLIDIKIYDEYMLVLFNLDIFSNYALIQEKNRNKFQFDINNLIDVLKENIFELKDVLFYDKGNILIGFLPNISEISENYKEIISKIRSYMYKCLKKGKINIGVSDWSPVYKLKEAYNKAYLSLKVSDFFNNNNCVFYDELGILKFFIEKNGDINFDFIDDFYGQTIQPLVVYDKKNNTNLLDTLKNYLINDCSIIKTAQSLFIHENTLRARLFRIESLTGKSVRNNDDLFDLNLGMRIYFFVLNKS